MSSFRIFLNTFYTRVFFFFFSFFFTKESRWCSSNFLLLTSLKGFLISCWSAVLFCSILEVKIRRALSVLNGNRAYNKYTVTWKKKWRRKKKNETKQNKMQQVEKKRSGAVEKRRASEQQQQQRAAAAEGKKGIGWVFETKEESKWVGAKRLIIGGHHRQLRRD